MISSTRSYHAPHEDAIGEPVTPASSYSTRRVWNCALDWHSQDF
jgi:hypothetical protein